jgi:hypothetical protein
MKFEVMSVIGGTRSVYKLPESNFLSGMQG